MTGPFDHATLQARFHAALWQTEPPEGLDPRRFAVYRNNVQHGLCRALATRFPVIELMGTHGVCVSAGSGLLATGMLLCGHAG